MGRPITARSKRRSARTARPTGPWAVEREPCFADLGERFLKFKPSQQLRENTIKNLESAIRGHLPETFHDKLRLQPCATTLLAHMYPSLIERARAKSRDHRYVVLDRSINNLLAVLTEGWRLKVKPRLTAALESDELFDLILAAGTPRSTSTTTSSARISPASRETRRARRPTRRSWQRSPTPARA